jgi:acyl dehydratase
MRFLEDFSVGERFELGRAGVPREAMLQFSRAFDPQPFHVDDDAARRTHFGGIVASGWHTCSVYMRLLVTGLLLDTACLGSPGIDELRLPAPVRPGDVLAGAVTIREIAPSRRHPSRGTLLLACELRNQDDVLVLRFLCRALVARRVPGDAAPAALPDRSVAPRVSPR